MIWHVVTWGIYHDYVTEITTKSINLYLQVFIWCPSLAVIKSASDNVQLVSKSESLSLCTDINDSIYSCWENLYHQGLLPSENFLMRPTTVMDYATNVCEAFQNLNVYMHEFTVLVHPVSLHILGDLKT